MRKLIFIPTIHDLEFSGRYTKTIYSDSRITSNERRLEIDEEIKKTWSLIRRGILRLPKDLSGVRLFSEGATEYEESRVEELISKIRTVFPGSSVEKLMNPTKKLEKALEELLGWENTVRIYLRLQGVSLDTTAGRHFNEHGIIVDEMGDLELQLASRAMDWVKAKKSADPESISGFYKSVEDLTQKIEFLKGRGEQVMEQRDRDIAANINKRLK